MNRAVVVAMMEEDDSEKEKEREGDNPARYVMFTFTNDSCL